MTEKSAPQYEQVPLEFMVENAHETFAKTTLATRAKVILIGGFSDEASAVKNFLSKRKPDLDRRKKLSPEGATYVWRVEQYAVDAREYVEWVRSEGGVPLLNDALVSYCSAFENCLKAVAIAFLLAERHGDMGLKAQVLVPGPELREARRTISRQWSNADNDSRVQSFFESSIRRKKAWNRYQPRATEVSTADWETCSCAFQIRNAVVHNLGIMSQSVEIGRHVFHAGWRAELDELALAVVAEAFSKVVAPFARNELGF